MLEYILYIILATVLVSVVKTALRFKIDLENAKKTGLKVVPLPIPGNGFKWVLINDTLNPPLRALGFKWPYLRLNNRQEWYRNPRATNLEHGDTFITVAPGATLLRTTNAELISQITARKTDFPKPVHTYKVISIFGKSLVSVEGDDFRRHRRVVGPSFSEKSNKLVFEESLRQAMGMMDYWASQNSNTPYDIKVENTAIDTAVLSLHVICAAGFGLPQIWPHENPKEVTDDQAPGTRAERVSSKDFVTFKQSMQGVLRDIRWLLVFPRWMLRNSPFKVHRSVNKAFDECLSYFEQLAEVKRKEMNLGKLDNTETMDIMGPMVRAADEAETKSDNATIQAPTLSKSELIGNSFILFFAGHETSANSIHFSILLLAMHLKVQQKMQADIDSIMGRDKPLSELSYHRDMPRLYNSMVGGVLNEQLRLMPATLIVPKLAKGDQVVTMDGKEFVIKNGTMIQLSVVGTNRNPLYWPSAPSKVTPGTNDLNDFVPERWLRSHTSVQVEKGATDKNETETADSPEEASFDSTTPGSLFKPIKGSFMSFSEGSRACPGRRFAQVEVTAVLSAIFQKYSVELDVREWVSDKELDLLSKHERRDVYLQATQRARQVIANCEQRTITLQMKAGDHVPVKFVERGKERFAGIE